MLLEIDIVCERRVDLLVCSLPLHRHSYIGFILASLHRFIIKKPPYKLRYFDWDGQVHVAKGKTGGQEGDPLEMLIFNLTIHHLWVRVFS
jgi:hypothetical protein